MHLRSKNGPTLEDIIYIILIISNMFWLKTHVIELVSSIANPVDVTGTV